MATTAAVIGAVAAVASAGTGIAGAAGAFGGPEAPSTAMPKMPGDDAAKAAKTLLPGTKANAAASGLGGAAPDFLASMVDQNTGMPGGGMDILAEIRRSLGQGGTP